MLGFAIVAQMPQPLQGLEAGAFDLVSVPLSSPVTHNNWHHARYRAGRVRISGWPDDPEMRRYFASALFGGVIPHFLTNVNHCGMTLGRVT